MATSWSETISSVKNQRCARTERPRSDIMAQVADRIETRRERQELKRKQKEQRQPVEADQDRTRAGKFKAEFHALIDEQRAQRKASPQSERDRVE